MWQESSEQITPLRTGFTTGSCATACCVAAGLYLFTEQQRHFAELVLPRGEQVTLPLHSITPNQSGVRVSIIKDAGDDPDVTHQAEIWVQLQRIEHGIEFVAGQGVGTVTKAGLLLPIGEPAINPVPRQMMREHLTALAQQFAYQGGFRITIGVVNGEQLARKTMNPKLGILGGLSILGTTGIVRPYSCAAWIASIYQGIDVAFANGFDHIAACTGNASEVAIKSKYHFDDSALIEMGDFVGAVLKQVKKVPIRRLTLCAGFGKLSKLANGHMDLNSRVSDIDFDHMAALAKTLGASDHLLNKIVHANTSIEVLALCNSEQIPLAQAVCDAALTVMQQKIQRKMQLEVWAIDRHGQFSASARALSE